MSVKTRLLSLKLLKKKERHPEYAKKIGVRVDVVERKNDKQKHECTNFVKEAK